MKSILYIEGPLGIIRYEHY